MSADGLREVFHRLRRLSDPGSKGLSDAELLDRYVQRADEAAFELLLWRHGPMVHGVCRRVLRRIEDADDAFQATFLTLVRKASSVRRGAAVGAWLHQVAHRVALRVRASATPREPLASEPEASSTDHEGDWRELSPILDEEVRRLPVRYREPVVLCYLEGRTHAEAARELGCPKGTVAVRLMRSRKLLQKRLTRRGVTLAGGLLALGSIPPASAALVARTLRTAFGGPVSVRVTSLTDGVIRAMSLTYLKASAAVILLAAGLLAGGSAVLSRGAPPVEAQAAEPERPAAPAASSVPEKKELVLTRVPALRDGQLLVVGTEIKPGEKVAEDQRVVVTVGRFLVRVKEGESIEAAQVIPGRDGIRWRRWQENELVEPGQCLLQKEKKEFRWLEVGDRVKAGDTVAVIDPNLAMGEVMIKIAALGSSESERRASAKTKEEAESRVTTMEDSMRRVPGSVSKDDYTSAKLTAKRYLEEELAKRSAVNKTQQELIQSLTILRMHEIHAPVSGEIVSIERRTGEGAKALETILTIGTRRDARPSEPMGKRSTKARYIGVPRDGVLAMVGTVIKDGETVPADRVIKVGTGKEAKDYRRLEVGDTIEAGQLLARLEYRFSAQEVRRKEEELDASKEKLRRAEEMVLLIKDATREHETWLRERATRNNVRGEDSEAKPDDGLRAEKLKLGARRYAKEEAACKAKVALIRSELERTKMPATCEIYSPVRGVVRELTKHSGETVSVGEPILRVDVLQSRDR
jgi:RNA polymerase sigma factor (sigma-70 family)